jgi:adenylosuccinate lyase
MICVVRRGSCVETEGGIRLKYNPNVKHHSASNPLTERYASKEMSYLFSAEHKFRTWRQLWIALAEAEKELGLPITDAQIADLKAHADDINFEDAERREREVRHDVMAHIHAYGLQAVSARGIIHLGATSAYVTDNTDILQMRDGMRLLRDRIVNLLSKLRDFAWRWRATPALAFTHFQPAQLTTVGKRATLWMHDLLLDYEEIDHRLSSLALLGVKGATGTQASFLNLFDGDAGKVHRLESLVAEKMAMPRTYPVSGQTYSRKVDAQVVSALSGLAQSASKFGYDMRLLQHLHEIEEPFEEEQVGSSAMAYKRNPMRAERIDGLARHLIVNALNPAFTAATQWFERTLDDSANRRIAIPEAFLAADAIALLYDNVVAGLVVHEEVIAANVRRELPFLMTENLMMEGVRRGGDRQVLHERVRVHAHAAADALKRGATENDLFERIAADPLFSIDRASIESLARPEAYTGLSKEQTERFVIEEIDPILDRHRGQIRESAAEVRV